MEVKYRLEINYYAKDYSNCACEISLPIYTQEQGIKEYYEAIKKFCLDDSIKPVRTHLWEYNYINDKLVPITILKNY